MTLKFLTLRVRQLATFGRVDGLIFLTNYARDSLSGNIKNPPKGTRIIPHGIDERFGNAPRPQLPISDYSRERPFRLLYVSIVDVYKHQWNVADAVAQLRAEGLPIVLELIGPSYRPALRRLLRAVEQLDPDKQFIKNNGAVPHTELHSHYQEADLCVFASSCENMPNILLEKMAAGLPIACSDRGPMREVLGDEATYFNPEKPADIARAIKELIESPEQRSKQASASYQRRRAFSWKTAADETLRFLSGVAACSLDVSPP
jgi:glycosyltransferase involved in cell wall biosynthesis